MEVVFHPAREEPARAESFVAVFFLGSTGTISVRQISESHRATPLFEVSVVCRSNPMMAAGCEGPSRRFGADKQL